MVKKSRQLIGGTPVHARKSTSRTIGDMLDESTSASLSRKLKESQATPIKVHHRSVKVNPDNFSKDKIAKEKAKLQANKDFLSPVSTLDFNLSSKELKPDYSLKHRTDEHDTPRKKIGQKTKGKKKHTLRKVLIAILIIVLLGAGGVLLWGNDLIAKLTGGRSNIFEAIGALGSNVKLKTDANGRTNILVFGTSGYDMEGSEWGEVHDGAQLTDSIMVISIDQEQDDVAMVSLPRDLYIGHTCTATGKINELYYCATLYDEDEKDGADALAASITDILGLDIQYYVHLDWSALIRVVDSIGGITVTLDEDIEDDWTNIFIKAGEPVNLNGDQALALARARHGTEMGDFSRGNSQQKILTAIQQKIVEQGLDLGAVLNLVEVVGDNVRMNFSIEELKTIYLIAKDLNLADMRQIPLIDYDNDIAYFTTANIDGISYVVPVGGKTYYSDIHDYIAKMVSSNPAAREGASILVLNGSGVNGAASAEKSTLAKEGYTSVETGDAPDGEYPEQYYLYKITDKAPQTTESLSNKYSAQIRSADELPATIDKNYDIIIILGTEK